MKDVAQSLEQQVLRKQHERYSSGAMAESFTSTTRSLTTNNELRMQTEEEALLDLYDTVRKKKAKGCMCDGEIR